MVARHGRVVAHFVHDARDILALGERAERRALDGVAHVDEQHVLARFFQRRADAGHARVAKAIAGAAMYVGRKEDHGLRIGESRVLRTREGLRGGREQQERRRQAKEQQPFEYLVPYSCVFLLSPPWAGRAVRIPVRSASRSRVRARERPRNRVHRLRKGKALPVKSCMQPWVQASTHSPQPVQFHSMMLRLPSPAPAMASNWQAFWQSPQPVQSG